MLLSLQELIVWTGLGPFEVALHSFGLLIFTCLTTLQLEGVVSTSWHAIFSPLYVALGLHVYHLTVVSMRMVIWGFKNTSRKALMVIIPLSFVGVSLLVYLEYTVASYLDGSTNQLNLLTSFVALIFYLLVRIIFVYRALISPTVQH